MFDQEDGELNVVIGVLFGVIALVIALVIGLGTWKLRAADVPAPVAAAAGEFADVTEVGEALVKFYFAVGEATLPADASPDIATIVVALDAAPGKKVLLSGFHDETGGAAVNAEVSKNRALAVRDALLEAGVPAERVLLRRPAVTLGGGDAAEARRVEARVQ
ncbi:OmpA family protein [Aromatoleum tolulyticum]|uniref:OmpA family protein n=1 Tax=Aromatoleum tolulyticum TaxID=34027 RepID=A0A1N6VVK6_9RHOO|nr:OmpA family protein [Aromatoleum tolulyticum]SIQ81852.1 OmpA family protein [Aromatoleum tolulyticum]